MNSIFPEILGCSIIPIDELIFFRGVAQPATRCYIIVLRAGLKTGGQIWDSAPRNLKSDYFKSENQTEQSQRVNHGQKIIGSRELSVRFGEAMVNQKNMHGRCFNIVCLSSDG